ncbi:MAG: DGQHR domain-containing protein, partial [Candidatus Zixiibacteriota bacterium]
LEHAQGNDIYKLIFRNLFVDEKDAIIANVVWNYFSVVSDKWPHSWNEQIEGRILNRTTGFGALMRFLKNAFKEVSSKEKKVPEKEDFKKIFTKMKLKEDDFTRENFVPGSTGEGQLYRTLCEQTGLS